MDSKFGWLEEFENPEIDYGYKDFISSVCRNYCRSENA